MIEKDLSSGMTWVMGLLTCQPVRTSNKGSHGWMNIVPVLCWPQRLFSAFKVVTGWMHTPPLRFVDYVKSIS